MTYETLQTVMPKDEALDTVHEYVAARARKMRKILLVLMRIPGLYKKVPGVFTTQTRKMFGTTAGFAATEHQTGGGVWRIDMTKCPYHDTCVQYGCPKLCPCRIVSYRFSNEAVGRQFGRDIEAMYRMYGIADAEGGGGSDLQ